jgi:hypothetical protein
MSRLLRLTIVMIFFLAGVVYAIRLFRSAQTSQLAMWFTNPDNSPCATPCLFGITPGTTRFEEAIQIVSKHPITRNMQRGQIKDQNSLDSFRLSNDNFCFSFWQNQNGRVEGIVIRTDECFFPQKYTLHQPQQLDLGQLVAILGVPGLELGAYGIAPDYYFFFDGTLYFEAGLEKNSCIISPYTNPKVLIFTNNHRASTRWRGFSNRSLYTQTDAELASLTDCSD